MPGSLTPKISSLRLSPNSTIAGYLRGVDETLTLCEKASVLLGCVILPFAILALLDPVGTKMADDNNPFGDPGGPLYPILLIFISIVFNFLAVGGQNLQEKTTLTLDYLMQSKRDHIFSAFSLSIGCYALTVIFSGAPLRVHLVDAISLLIAFTIPAAYISQKKDIQKNRFQIISFWLLGTIIWFFLSSVVVAKAELSLFRLTTLLVGSLLGLLLFVSAHLALLKLVASYKNKR